MLQDFPGGNQRSLIGIWILAIYIKCHKLSLLLAILRLHSWPQLTGTQFAEILDTIYLRVLRVRIMVKPQHECGTTVTDIDIFYSGSSLIVNSSQHGPNDLKPSSTPGICKQVLTPNRGEETGFDKERKGSWPIGKPFVLRGKPWESESLSPKIVEAPKFLMIAANSVLVQPGGPCHFPLNLVWGRKFALISYFRNCDCNGSIHNLCCYCVWWDIQFSTNLVLILALTVFI